MPQLMSRLGRALPGRDMERATERIARAAVQRQKQFSPRTFYGIPITDHALMSNFDQCTQTAIEGASNKTHVFALANSSPPLDADISLNESFDKLRIFSTPQLTQAIGAWLFEPPEGPSLAIPSAVINTGSHDFLLLSSTPPVPELPSFLYIIFGIIVIFYRRSRSISE